MVEQPDWAMARTSPSNPLRGGRRLITTTSTTNRSDAQAMRGVSHSKNRNQRHGGANPDHTSHGFVVLDRPNRSSTLRSSQHFLSKESTSAATTTTTPPTAILPVPVVIKPLASLQPEQPQALPSWMAMSAPPSTDCRPPSGSGGLDLLMIALAKEQERQEEERRLQKHHHDETSAVSTSASSSEDDEDGVDNEEANSSRRMMPPPPPRRPRSNSSPASMTPPTTAGPAPPVLSAVVGGTSHHHRQHQQHVQLLLPDSFLQRELAELRRQRHSSSQQRARGGLSTPPTIFEDAEWNETPSPVVVEPAERLRLIKSRLLQEVSTGPHHVTFPHELPQYQNLYNCAGRVGVYDEVERALLLARFHDKRQARNWSKSKIRYDCRKNLADRRVRVKGRFVKKKSTTTTTTHNNSMNDGVVVEDSTATSLVSSQPATTTAWPVATTAPVTTMLPDVNDPDAGFCPTDDQPYRRLRRHTLT